MRRDALSVDVPKNVTNRALQHVAAETSGGLATVECRLDGVGDGIHNGVHRRYRVSHVLFTLQFSDEITGKRPCRGRRDQSVPVPGVHGVLAFSSRRQWRARA